MTLAARNHPDHGVNNAEGALRWPGVARRLGEGDSATTQMNHALHMLDTYQVNITPGCFDFLSVVTIMLLVVATPRDRWPGSCAPTRSFAEGRRTEVVCRGDDVGHVFYWQWCG